VFDHCYNKGYIPNNGQKYAAHFTIDKASFQRKDKQLVSSKFQMSSIDEIACKTN
jgi:hypothetical protein